MKVHMLYIPTPSAVIAVSFFEEECPSFIVVLYLLLSAGERKRSFS
jgi:hypothetical protein